MGSAMLAVLIVGFFFLLLLVTSMLNQNYKKDINVRGFIGNCEKCSSFSCHKHPKYEEKMNEIEEDE